MIITIDGPTASGKSTTARALADKIGIYYLNSGKLYRAFAYLLMEHAGYTEQQLAQPKEEDIFGYLSPNRLVYTYTPEESERIFFDDEDITPYLHGNATIDQAASIVSQNNQVREKITDLCREIGNKFSLVADGRDTGSVVFPHATVKFYLTASLPVRAQRWQEFISQRGTEISLQEAEEQLVIRDKRDMDRAVAPLVAPEGAIFIDNSELPLTEVIGKMLEHITW